MTLSIRSATATDIPLIAQFIRDLAEYERLAHEVRFDETVLEAKLFGARPYAEVLIGEIDGSPQGFALFFPFPLRGAGEAASLLAIWGEVGGEGVSRLLPAFPAGSWGVSCSSAAYPCAAFLAARAILLRAFRWSLTS